MIDTVLGSKGKMSQTFVEDTRVPVTYIKVGPCVVTQIKNKQKDGYWAIQLGFGERKIKNIKKPVLGHIKKAIKDLSGADKAPRFLREIRLENEPDLNVGDVVDGVEIFKKGDVIQITGISKSKGFQGVVKRWHFAGGPKTHGQSDRWRAPGSIGQTTTPGRVFKGKKMAGRMGGETFTIKNLIVVDINKDTHQIATSGPIPGNKGGLLLVKKLASGSLEELVEEAPEVKIQEEPEEEEKSGSAQTEAKEVKNNG